MLNLPLHHKCILIIEYPRHIFISDILAITLREILNLKADVGEVKLAVEASQALSQHRPPALADVHMERPPFPLSTREEMEAQETRIKESAYRAFLVMQSSIS